MFRRDARNKLRNMGGIMASSEPLIQEVAKFNQGMMVQANQTPLVGSVDPRPTSIFQKGYTGPMFLEDLKAGKFGSFSLPSIINPKTGGVKAIEYVRDKTLEDLGISPMEDAEGVFTRSGKILDNNPALKTFLTTGSTSGYDRFGDVFDDILTDGVQVLGAGVIDVLFDKNLQFIPDRNQPTDKALVEFMSGDRDKIPTDMQDSKQMLQFIASSGLPKETKKKLAKELPITDASVFRKKEAKTAIAGGAPDPAQTGTTDADEIQKALDAAELKAKRGPGGAEERRADLTGARRGEDTEVDADAVKALQDQISGGRISSEAPQTLGVTADQGTEYDHKLATDQFRKDGNLNNVKDTVQNTVKSGIGTGGALKQLMNEFTSNAPEYEGMDRGLAIAKIGFAMAAGQSPNAITNIANALSQGADMFLKDDEQRRNFKRQVELAGLQYGLGEISKMRTEARAQARQDRNLKYFVAGKNMKVNGVAYEKGSVVPISEGYIREKGIPSGLTTENLVKGAQTLKGQLEKLLAEQNEKKIMSDKDYRANREIVTNAASKFEESRNLMTLIEGSIYKVAGGEVTGLMPKVEDLMNRAFQAAGVNRDEEGQTLAEYNRDMQEVANKLIKEIIQEGGKNISNVDRQLAQEIVGLFTRRGGYITEDPDVLLGRLQSIHRTLKTTQTKAVADMTDMLELSIGRTFQSGAPVTYSRVGELQLGAIQGAKGGTKDIFLKDLLTDGQVDASKVSSIFGLSS